MQRYPYFIGRRTDGSHLYEKPSEAKTYSTVEERLSELFGSYKAEWLREHIFDYYTEPQYFPELTTSRPCVLIGGRGTGKTTVLRGLSYEGRYAIQGSNPKKIPSWPYFGLYYRVNTNRVTAFKGPELDHSQWVRLFAHYFSLLCCDMVLRFLHWFQKTTSTQIDIPADACVLVAASLNIPRCNDWKGLAAAVRASLVEFEAYINNVAGESVPPSLSMQGAGIDSLVEALTGVEAFRGKQFFFLIDEYENFEDYQQQIVNTIIKHSGGTYTFKLGIRELGWRRRTTLNENEQLVSPADYVRINIAEKLDGQRFADFAANVCNDRLSKLEEPQASLHNIGLVFPGLTEDEEAVRLGIEESLTQLKTSLLKENHGIEALEVIDRLPPLAAYLVLKWPDGRSVSLVSRVQDFSNNPTLWATRIGNYKHALLYALRGGKRGLRKYYCGWETFLLLAGGNIRYLLELVDNALLIHLRRSGRIGEAVEPEVQTEAAQMVGRKNLAELEGLSVHGAQLTKLVLGLGRVFQVMASNPIGHTPELNQFHLAQSESGANANKEQKEVLDLLNAAVMHLALVRTRGNKPADEGDTREYDYMMHPIFSAFFVFSYRKKRKMTMTENELMRLISHPRDGIREILERQHRIDPDDLPQQSLPFAAYYHGDA